MNQTAAPTRPSPLPRTGILAPDGTRFTWGPIQQIHGPIDGITVVEYLEDNSNNRTQPHVWLRHGAVRFHPYIDGRDTNHSYARLDSAIVGAIAMRRAGLNTQAARHFDLMTLGALPGEND